MPEHLWAEQFRDENAGSLYPFADGSTLADDSGAIALDRDMFVDASIYPLGGDAGLYLSRVVIDGRAAAFWFGTPASPDLCHAEFDPLVPPSALVLGDAYARPAGVLVCDPTVMAIVQTWADGEYTFDEAATAIVASCVIPMPTTGLQGLLVGDELVSGDVWIVGERGVVVRYDAGTVRVDVVGDPLFARRACQADGAFATPSFVRTINGVAPDRYGNFQFDVSDLGAPDTILRVTPIAADSLLIQAVGKTIEG